MPTAPDYDYNGYDEYTVVPIRAQTFEEFNRLCDEREAAEAAQAATPKPKASGLGALFSQNSCSLPLCPDERRRPK